MIRSLRLFVFFDILFAFCRIFKHSVTTKIESNYFGGGVKDVDFLDLKIWLVLQEHKKIHLKNFKVDFLLSNNNFYK